MPEQVPPGEKNAKIWSTCRGKGVRHIVAAARLQLVEVEIERLSLGMPISLGVSGSLLIHLLFIISLLRSYLK